MPFLPELVQLLDKYKRMEPSSSRQLEGHRMPIEATRDQRARQLGHNHTHLHLESLDIPNGKADGVDRPRSPHSRDSLFGRCHGSRKACTVDEAAVES
jgi:hypothetical protein